MAGWTPGKRQAFEAAFYSFLSKCFINSKNLGFVSLGANLYEGQRRFITAVLDGLEQDKHDVYVLKSRQLGLSTIARALSIFYIGLHRGLKGALVFDTSSNKEEARAELETMIEDLPKSLKFPAVKTTNREGITLVNSSKILFKSAGTKKSSTSGTLGRSVGLAMSHASELCNFVDIEGIISYKRSLSDSNPDRLYIWESTARGYNLWKKMWDTAREDDTHCTCVFIGWWGHDGQRIERGTPDWQLYGEQPPTDIEIAKIKAVKEQYDYEISQEQLAWYRRLIDPTSRAQGDADAAFDEGDTYKLQEDPWTEDEAFQQAGSIFFAAETLKDLSTKHVSQNFQTYMYVAGSEFVDMRVIKAQNTKSIDLKVWEEPDQEGVYVLSCDPAFGENETNDRSSIQVCRCYADGLDQVAEYASPLINTRQLAWVIASLLGWYGGKNARIRYALELNGPGMAVFNELKSLKHQVESKSYLEQQLQEQGLKDIFRNVRTYIYTRPDSMGAGFNFHIKTSGPIKITLMERLRDYVSNEKFRVRSASLVEEMRSIAREGDSISAPSTMKDDRVLAASFAVHCWESSEMRTLMTQNRTRAAEAARKQLSISDRVYLFQQNQLSQFFDQKRRVRVNAQRQATRQSWRYGR